jgi:hypothetical protein
MTKLCVKKLVKKIHTKEKWYIKLSLNNAELDSYQTIYSITKNDYLLVRMSYHSNISKILQTLQHYQDISKYGIEKFIVIFLTLLKKLHILTNNYIWLPLFAISYFK